MKMRTYVLGCGLLLVLVSFALAQNTSAPASNQIPDLVLANHILSNERVLDAYGHVSVRDERNPTHYLLARAIPAGTVQASDIVEYDVDSKTVGDPSIPAFSERFIHGEIYRVRPDVKAIVHFHAPEVIPFTVTSVPLRPMIHVGGFLPQVIGIFEIRDAAGMSDMLVRNNDIGKALAKTLGDKTVVLLRGHGAVATGPSLHIATGRAYYMIDNARAQLQSMMLAGGKLTYLDPEEANKAMDQDGFERAWTLWKSKWGK